ncbi:MAG: hypothetical protein QOK49_2270 [Baekduia sp.]|jgi:hypothetical protein|nr:hypothetical protein [Baekduia sp.]
MRRALLVLAGLVVVVLVVGQIVLPRVAAQRLRSGLEQHGSDVQVHVEAMPAIKLLWHKADRVTVRVGHLRPGGSGSGKSLPDLLASTKATGDLDVQVAVLDAQRLTVHDAGLHKTGNALVAHVRVTNAAVDQALPPRLRVSAQQVAPDRLEVRGLTHVFGRQLSGRAMILIDDRGRVVLRPEGVPLASFISVPVFSDDRVAVDGLSTSQDGDGFTATVRGHLR